MKKTILVVILALALCVGTGQPAPVLAEQGGLGHYIPGAVSSFIDSAPDRDKPFAAENLFLFYDGSASGDREFVFGGRRAANINLTAYAEIPTFAYTSPVSLLGGNLAFAVSIPYISMDVSATVTRKFVQPNGTVVLRTVHASDSADGIADVLFIPFWLAWSHGALKWDTRLLVYAPTGEYHVGQLANVGMNYWTFTPMVSAGYISPKYGYEISGSAGLDFNTENNAIHYQSGDVLHFDITAAQHLPFFGLGIAGVGANIFFWQQITGDSGSRALLGPFKSRTVGVGPVVSFIDNSQKFIFEVKWLPGMDVDNHLSGSGMWFKAVYNF